MGLGTVFGHALQGLGAGMAAQYKMKDEERREVAREKLKAENMEREYQLRGKNEEAGDNRQNAGAMARTKEQGRITIEAASAGAEGMKAKAESEKERWKAELKDRENQWRSELQAEIEKNNADRRQDFIEAFGKPITTRTLNTGAVQETYLLPNGKHKTVTYHGVRGEPPKGSSGGSSLFDTTPSSTPTAQSTPPKRPEPVFEIKRDKNGRLILGD